MKARFIVLLALMAVIGVAPRAIAHSVETDFEFTAEGLEFTSQFSTGEPFENAEVQVFSPDNPTEPWMTGTTDENGRFSFQPDESISGEWEVRFGEGDHGDLWTVPVNEMGIDLDNISDAEPQFFASHPLVLTGVIGLGTVAGLALYLSRKEKTL